MQFPMGTTSQPRQSTLSFLSCLAYGKLGLVQVSNRVKTNPAMAKVLAPRGRTYMTAVILLALQSPPCQQAVLCCEQECRSVPGCPAGVDHDQELHQAIVDITGRSRLDDEDVLVADRLSDCDRRLLVRVVERHGPGDLDAEPVSHTRKSAIRDPASKPVIRSKKWTRYISPKSQEHNVPAGDLVGQFHVAAATEKFDFVCHFA